MILLSIYIMLAAMVFDSLRLRGTKVNSDHNFWVHVVCL